MMVTQKQFRNTKGDLSLLMSDFVSPIAIVTKECVKYFWLV